VSKKRLIKGVTFIVVLCLLVGMVVALNSQEAFCDGQQKEKQVKIMPMPQRKILSAEALPAELKYVELQWIQGEDKVVVNLRTSIEILDINTGKREKVLEIKNVYDWPSISSDGRNVIFTELIPYERSETYIYNLKGKKKEFISKGIVEGINWSPDGRYVVYTRLNKEVYVFDVEEGKSKKILESDFWDPELLGGEFDVPKWLPKSNKISILTNEGLCVMNPDGTDLRRISNEVPGNYQWFPDEKRICFASGGGVFILDIEKNIRTKIGKASDHPRYIPMDDLSLSPDGKKVAYHYAIFGPEDPYEDERRPPPQGDSEIYIYDVETKETVNITNTPNQLEEFPRWSSDGKRIICKVDESFFDGECWREVRIPIVIEVK